MRRAARASMGTKGFYFSASGLVLGEWGWWMAWINNWMSLIPDNRRLIDIIVPGSHDAGVWPEVIELKVLNDANLAICQNGDFYAQATCGSRFFDCRVFLRKAKEGRTINERLRMAHFAGFAETTGNKGKTGSAGAYGGTLKQCLDDAIQFVKHHGRECLILRFSHTGDPALVNLVVRGWRDFDTKWQRHIYVGTGNIASKQMHQLRGKVIMIFEKDTHKTVDPLHGIHPFEKWKKGRAVDEGLSCCGKYAESDDATTVVVSALKASEEHAAHVRNHLHFVYYQQTMFLEDIKAATEAPVVGGAGGNKLTGGVHANLDRYLGMLTERVKNEVARLPGRQRPNDVSLETAFPTSLQFRYPNVVSHDFVCEDTCKKIVKMNPEVVWPG